MALPDAQSSRRGLSPDLQTRSPISSANNSFPLSHLTSAPCRPSPISMLYLKLEGHRRAEQLHMPAQPKIPNEPIFLANTRKKWHLPLCRRTHFRERRAVPGIRSLGSQDPRRARPETEAHPSALPNGPIYPANRITKRSHFSSQHTERMALACRPPDPFPGRRDRARPAAARQPRLTPD